MIFKFKINLIGLSNPPVWRRVEVPAEMDFLSFHIVIQKIFGWENCHLWSFEPRRKRGQRTTFRIEDPNENFDSMFGFDAIVASETNLNEMFPKIKELV